MRVNRRTHEDSKGTLGIPDPLVIQLPCKWARDELQWQDKQELEPMGHEASWDEQQQEEQAVESLCPRPRGARVDGQLVLRLGGIYGHNRVQVERGWVSESPRVSI